ncbi:hypothetical protein LOK49_LG03G00623 [Camellia lanceoleosa]|uniref:Uncharacterized protein n=1 Tax=Camellia lanceoleosa TaxID=1840588 RepID=A0ACC0IBG2_9ERIC|nr:hypothetical protein LOK49_LG03G00623 [Camellia lanceoleosa]
MRQDLSVSIHVLLRGANHISGSASASALFVEGFSILEMDKVQSLEIEIEDDSYVGMPFVLVSGGKWIKNDGSDFYVKFDTGYKQAQKDAGDGQGTAKTLLDKIAKMESEAQQSFNALPSGILAFSLSLLGMIIFLIIKFYCRRRRCIASVKAVAFWKDRDDDQNIEVFMRQYGSLAPKRQYVGGKSSGKWTESKCGGFHFVYVHS